MICPFCGKDGSQEDGSLRVYKNDPHDFLKVRRRGMVCGHCNAIYETEERATGEYYHKRPKDPAQLELLIESIERRTDLAREDRQKLQQVKRELRRIHNTAG